MAYERIYDDEQDELQRQMGAQPVRSFDDAPQGNSTQPVIDAPSSVAPPANPLGGSNTGVAGGKDMGPVAPTMPPAGGADPRAGYARAAASNNYSDIEGAGSLKTGAHMGGLEGFNTGAWGTNERGANTHKNTFGKIASRYDPRQPGASKALMADPDFQAYFPDAKLVEHPNGDLIDFGDGKPVDVLRGAQAGGAGEAWQWGVDAGGGAGASAGGMNVSSLINGDPLSGINSNIDALVGNQNDDEQNIIQQILKGEFR